MDLDELLFNVHVYMQTYGLEDCHDIADHRELVNDVLDWMRRAIDTIWSTLTLQERLGVRFINGPRTERTCQHRQSPLRGDGAVRGSRLTAVVVALGPVIGVPANGGEIPDRILVKNAYPDDKWSEDGTLLWIKAERLSREIPATFRDAASMNLDALADEAFDAIFQASSDEPLNEQFFWLWLSREAARDRYGSAQSLGLEDGQLLRDNEVCEAPTPESENRSRAYSNRREVPASFPAQVEQARASVVGRVTDIVPGFHVGPVLMLELEVEESLVPSQFSSQPLVLLPIGSFVAEDTVYCSNPRTFSGYFPQPNDRMIVMPSSGPWDENESVILLTRHHELFIVGSPDELGVQQVLPLVEAADGSTPTTLQRFREAVWEIRGRLLEPEGDTPSPN